MDLETIKRLLSESQTMRDWGNLLLTMGYQLHLHVVPIEPAKTQEEVTNGDDPRERA